MANIIIVIIISNVIGALIVGQVSACLPPHRTNQDNDRWTSHFKMTPGDTICLDDQVIRMVESWWMAPTTHLYNTAPWSYTVVRPVVDWDCVGGACNRSACVGQRFGATDKATLDLSKTTDSVTRSYCEVFASNGWSIPCPSGYGCRHADIDVTIELHRLAGVYRVIQPSSYFAMEGEVNGCTLQVGTRRTPAVGIGSILSFADGAGRKLCTGSDNKGYPELGKIGDLQIVGEGSFAFDWDSVHVSLDWVTSPDVQVGKSFLTIPQESCHSLPVTIDGWTWQEMMTDSHGMGYLKIEDDQPVDVELRCDHIPQQQHFNEECHEVRKEIHGVRDSGFGLMLLVRALSLNGTGSLRLKSSCGEEFDKWIQCDGEDHLIEIDDRNDCFDTIAGIVDKTESSSRAGYLVLQHTPARGYSGSGWGAYRLLTDSWWKSILWSIGLTPSVIIVIVIVIVCLIRR